MILDELKKGGKAAMAKALAMIESAPLATVTIDLLDHAYSAPQGRVIGLTGPPGVGKSTLINALIGHWRHEGRTVGCIAIDPSSRRSKGALLGDRTRLSTDPEDQGIFFRSMAARDRLGGLAALTVSAMVLMRAVYDIVLIETVGVGQSETDVSMVADTVLFCVQPGSGDSLQFMKAGIAEIPHVVCVTKSDMRAEALRAKADVEGALTLSPQAQEGERPWTIPVVLISARQPETLAVLTGALDRHWQHLADGGALGPARTQQARQWLDQAVLEDWGRRGLALVKKASASGKIPPLADQFISPFSLLRLITKSMVLTLSDKTPTPTP